MSKKSVLIFGSREGIELIKPSNKSTDKVVVMGAPGKVGVEEASEILKKFYFIEREIMRTLGGFHVNVASWELKKALPRHMWQDSLRADLLRTRVLEMRYPRRDVDQGHNVQLEEFLASLIRSESDAELVAGVYFVAKEALITAYASYLENADPLDDLPTIEFMKRYASQIQEQIDEIKIIFPQLQEGDVSAKYQIWMDALKIYLHNIGGPLCKVGGNGEVPEVISSRKEYVPPIVPRRDPKFSPALYHMPKKNPEKFIDLQVWQGINHVNEMWAAEIPALVLWKWNDMPWDFYLECARWSFDESRHSMMGEQRLKSWGFEIGVDYPVIADHYMSASIHDELHVLALLHALETNGPGWKSGLKSDFESLGDTASSQDFDYDWADESIHLNYGYKWVLHRLNNDLDALENIKQDTLQDWTDWIEQKHTEWDYEPFMSRINNKINEIEAKQHG